MSAQTASGVALTAPNLRDYLFRIVKVSNIWRASSLEADTAHLNLGNLPEPSTLSAVWCVSAAAVPGYVSVCHGDCNIASDVV